MTVVSDTSVLIHLARIDRFDHLRRHYSEIDVPEAVWRETVVEGEGLSRRVLEAVNETPV